MRKRNRFMIWFMTAALAIGMCSGCGKKKDEETEPAGSETPVESTAEAPDTAAELVAQVRDALSEASSAKGALSMEMVMNYKAQGVEASLEYVMKQEMEMTREPEAVHMAGTIDINLMGETIDTETYTVKENNQYVTYMGSGGQWVKQTSEISDSQVDIVKTMDLLLNNQDSLKMTEIKAEGGNRLYQVTGEITGGNLSGLTSGLSSLLEENPDIYKELKANVTVSVDALTGLPTEISMDFTDSYNVVMQAGKEAQGFDEVEVVAFYVTMSGYEINGVEAITVPDEIKANAVDMDHMGTDPEEETAEETENPEEPETEDGEIHQNESGEYVLKTDGDGVTANIAEPEGFTYDTTSDQTWLGFHSRKNDSIHELSLVYNLYVADDNYGEEDLAQSQESSYAYMRTSGDYAEISFEPVQTVTAAGQTVSYTKLSYIYLGTIYCEEYNSWTTLSDGRMIQCTVKEESREEPCDRIDTGTIFDTAFEAFKE